MLQFMVVNYHNRVAQKALVSNSSAVQVDGRYFGSQLDTEW